MLTTHNQQEIIYKTRIGKSSHSCGKWRPWNALQSLNAIQLGIVAAGLLSAIPVSHFHAPPESMTIYREDSHSHTPYQESLQTPDLLPCAHLSRYLDI